jgi:hypothetical protein
LPKIIPFILNQIVFLKTTKFISNNKIHTLFHTAESWNEIHEEVLFEVKILLNMGKYEAIFEIDNISILIELFYDWLEYNIHSVFDIVKIAKLLETDGSKIDHTWKGTLHENLIMKMDLSSDRLKMYEFIKTEIRCIEYECLVCICEFINEIYPEFEDDNLNFNECLENICYRLFGFTSDDIKNSTNPGKSDNILLATRKFMDLIEFMVYFKKHDSTNNELLSKVSNSNFYNGNTLNSFKKAFNSNSNFDLKQILNNSLQNPEKDLNVLNKEKFMINIYETLNRYFNRNIQKGIYMILFR